MFTTINTSNVAVYNYNELNNQVNVVVVSDCEISMAGLKTILRKNSRVTVVAECENMDNLSSLCSELKPDVVIFNVSASREAICKAAENVISQSKATRMIVLNKTWSINHISEGVSRGILGFVTPPNPAGCLMIALESVVRGCLWIGPSPMLTTEQAKQSQPSIFNRLDTARGSSLKNTLSPRESEIADLVSQGLSNRAIAEVLIITIDTVKSHLHHIMTKLDVRDRTQIVMKLHPLAQDQQESFTAVASGDKLATLHSNVRLRAS